MDSDLIISGGSEPQKRTRGKALIIVAIIFLLLLLGAGGAYGYSKLDWFKSAKQIYLESEASTFHSMAAAAEQGYDEYYNENIKPTLDNPLRSESEISLNVSGNPPSDPQLVRVLELLKQSKLLLTYCDDFKGKQDYTKIDWGIGANSSLISAEVFTDKEKTWVRVPALYKKYGVVYAKDSDKFKTRYGFELPKRNVTPAEYINALKVPQSEYQPILDVYARLYTENLKNKQVSINKGTFTEGGTKIPVRVITVTFTAADLQNLLPKLADQLDKDDKLAEVLYKRYANLQQLYAEAGVSEQVKKQVGPKSKDDIKQELKKFTKDLRYSVNPNTTKGLKMVVYIDQNHRVLDRQITDMGNSSNLFRLANYTDNNGKQFNLLQFKDKSGELKVNYTYKPEGKTEQRTLDIFHKPAKPSETNAPFDLTSKFTIKKDGDKQSNQVSFSVSTQDKGKPVKISGDIQSNWQKNDKKKSREGDGVYKLSLDVPDFKGTNFEIKLKSKEEYGVPITLQQVNANNSVDLANMTDREKAGMQNEIQLGLQGLIRKNISLFMKLFPQS